MHFRISVDQRSVRVTKKRQSYKKAAMGMLISTEKRLAKNATHAEVYQKQIEDMVDREVARKLTLKELKEYKGPIHYISHHEVLKPE